ncbi:MAG TPA: hypothetical protein VFE62_25830, partial [Gemmataceae bacterium]|nr:hypothetical protein [Gemmataceae bacterium]
MLSFPSGGLSLMRNLHPMKLTASIPSRAREEQGRITEVSAFIWIRTASLPSRAREEAGRISCGERIQWTLPRF